MKQISELKNILNGFLIGTMPDSLVLHRCYWHFSKGFRFEDTHLTKQDRIEKLMALLVVGFCWAHKVGNGELNKNLSNGKNIAMVEDLNIPIFVMVLILYVMLFYIPPDSFQLSKKLFKNSCHH